MGYRERLRQWWPRGSASAEGSPRPPKDPRAAWLALIAQVKEHLDVGDYPGGVRRAYLGALEDLQRTYGITVPPGRTNEEIIGTQITGRSAQAGDILRRLYDVYRPLRYGPPTRSYDKEPILELLRDLYGNFALWELERQLSSGEGDTLPTTLGGPEGEAP